MSSPVFSILIPTRNRAHLLRYAVESALNQSIGDYEVVVSDNFSADNTREVAASFSDPRLRYVRTDRVLAMPDSWEFALSHARGEWITVLCDDSVLSACLLRDVSKIIRELDTPAVSWPYAVYFHPSWPDAEKRDTLAYSGFNARVKRVKSARYLKELYDNVALSAVTPSLYKAFCRRHVIEEVKKKTPKIFLPPAPDYSSGAAVLFTVKEFAFANRPYTIMGTAKESIGESHNQYRGEAFKNYLSEFSEEKLLSHVPTQLLNLRNFIAEALLRTAKAMGENVEINWTVYFRESYRDLLRLEKNGLDTSEEKKELLRCMEAAGFSKLKQELSSITADEKNPGVIIEGKERKFGNILSALAFLDRIAESPSAKLLSVVSRALQRRGLFPRMRRTVR